MKNIYILLRSISISIILVCFLVFPIQGQVAKIKKKDGLTIVHNPKNPVEEARSPSALVLSKDLIIGESTNDENYMFSEIRSLVVNNEEDIIVLDGKEDVIKVFDKSGTHIRTFGNRGQGPGEFQTPSRMYIKGGKDILILDIGNNRLSYYSKEGKCLKEIKLGKYSRIIRAMPDSRGYLYGDLFNIGDKITNDLMKFDLEFNLVETIAKLEQNLKYPEVNPLPERFVYQVMHDDRFIWATSVKYEFNIRNGEGRPLMKIFKNYDPVKATQEAKNRWIKDVYGDEGLPSGVKLVFPKNFPAFYYFICDDRGQLYVRTFEESEEGDIKWDIFDAAGIYRISFFHSPKEFIFVIKNNKAYAFMDENKDGIPVVLRYQMDWR